MSSKETNLKEKFRIALTSTAKVIADDFEINNRSTENKKAQEINSLEVDTLNSPSDLLN